MSKTLLLGAIASIIAINSVLADTVVTSRNYVDTQVATKQNKIDATGANFTNGSVVETTSTPGVVTQRAIFDPGTNFDWDTNEVASGHEGDLVTADIYPAVGEMYNQIQEIQNNMPDFDDLPKTTTTNKVCTEWVAGQAQTDANCLLWNLTDQTVYGCLARGALCRTNSQCCNGRCNPGESFDTGYCN